MAVEELRIRATAKGLAFVDQKLREQKRGTELRRVPERTLV